MFVDFPTPEEWVDCLINSVTQDSIRTENTAEFCHLTYKSGYPVYYSIFKIWNEPVITRSVLRKTENLEKIVDIGIPHKLIKKSEDIDFFDLPEEYLTNFFHVLVNKILDTYDMKLNIGFKLHKLLILLKQFPDELFETLKDKERNIVFVSFFRIINPRIPDELGNFGDTLEKHNHHYLIGQLIKMTLSYFDKKNFLTLAPLFHHLTDREFKKMIDVYITKYYDSDYFLQNVIYYLDGSIKIRTKQVSSGNRNPRPFFGNGFEFLYYIILQNLIKTSELQLNKVFHYLDEIINTEYRFHNKDQIINTFGAYRLNSNDKEIVSISKKILKILND